MSEGRVSARKCASNTIVSKGPDVCLTPRGSKMVPVPYSSIAFLDTAVRVSTSVRNNGKYDFQLNSRCASSIGTEPGTGRGVKSPGHLGPAHCDVAADYFFSEGYAVVAHRDPAWINRPDLGPQESQRNKAEVKI
jgi:hypothetical protein